MKYIIIGLGSYGSVLAEELTVLGHEVIGVDNKENRVEAIKDKITTSFILDASEYESIKILPIHSVDVVIVAIGEDFGASIKVVALLKMLKAKHIYARALDDVHKSVLQAFELDNILTPEKEAARNLVKLLELNIHIESLRIDKKHYIIKFKIPQQIEGHSIKELELEKKFNIKLISLLKEQCVHNFVGISTKLQKVDENINDEYLLKAGDQLVCYGEYKNFMAFWKAL